MMIYVYKGSLCEPDIKMGLTKQLEDGKQVDEFIKFFCTSIQPSAMVNYRLFIANNDVDKVKIDHYVNMEESLLIGVHEMKGFKEVKIPEVMREVNSTYDTRVTNQEALRSRRGSLL